MCLDMCRSTFMTGLSDGPQTLQAQTVELGCKTMEVLWGGWDITSTSIQFLQYHYNPMYILKWPTQFNFITCSPTYTPSLQPSGQKRNQSRHFLHLTRWLLPSGRPSARSSSVPSTSTGAVGRRPSRRRRPRRVGVSTSPPVAKGITKALEGGVFRDFGGGKPQKSEGSGMHIIGLWVPWVSKLKPGY